MKKNRLLIVTAVVLAAVIALLYGAGFKNVRAPRIDCTETGVLSENETVQTFLKGIETPCTISYVTDGVNTDVYAEETARRIAAANGKIRYERISLAEGQRRSDNAELAEGAVIVSGLRTMVLTASDLYRQSGNYSSTGAYIPTEYALIAEQAIAEAVDYATRQDIAKVYVLGTLPAGFAKTLAQSGREAYPLEGDAVPADAAAVIVYAPEEDIPQSAADALDAYIGNGGTVVLYTSYKKTEWPVLDAFTAKYGMKAANGLVLESEAPPLFTTQYPYLFVSEAVDTTLAGSDVTQLVFPLAHAIEKTDDAPASVRVQTLFTTTASAYRKPDITKVASFEKEENDVDGPFDLAMMATSNGGNVLWFASTDMVMDDADSYYAKGANTQYAALAIDTLTGTIPAGAVNGVDTGKNLMAEKLSFEGGQQKVVSVAALGLPLCVLALCLVLLPSRKKRK